MISPVKFWNIKKRRQSKGLIKKEDIKFSQPKWNTSFFIRQLTDFFR